jgi:hypothetical protein
VSDLRAYEGGIRLRDVEGRDRGCLDVRGGALSTTLTLIDNTEISCHTIVVDLFSDEDVMDLIAALRMSLERKHQLQAAAGGPV